MSEQVAGQPEEFTASASSDSAAATDQNQAGFDTVAYAAQTPELELPWAELGLKEDEYQKIVELLGRRPTNAELAMYSVMWSEHCSYKSSKVHLSTFGKHTTEEMKKHLLVGIGQNAGVVDIGDGWAVTFKVESHNHPSFVEPYQGAATGVGGIVRDIISMGARPIAVMDQLRFGAIDHPDTARLVHGVVSGIGGYGNSLGLPNIGGELVFDPAYQTNPLVNALAIGVMRHEDIHLANAEGPGNKVVLFGARTGGDGIGGASILASETFDDGGPSKRPAVQVGDPFMEKLLIECCMELFEGELVEAIQDLGAAGISCATSELASNGDSGMTVRLEEVLLRDPNLTPGEILMSESQERMMAIVSPTKLDEFLAVAKKWDVETAVIGEVTGDGRLEITWHGETIVDVDPKTVAHDGPVYHRPYAYPAHWMDELKADTISGEAGAQKYARPTTAEELRETVLLLLASPNLTDKSWVTNQFDRFVQGNTTSAQPDNAGVIRIDETTGRGVALSTDASGRYTKLDPFTGAQLALAEAYRNVATSGATPLAITDCLNFGSPEDPDSMWQLVEAINGLAQACETLGVPVTGGNVSVYNGTGEPGKIDSSIHPTPVVGVLGVFEDVSKVVRSGFTQAGDTIYLLGTTRDELDGSAWADVVHNHLGGVPPQVDLEAERTLAEILTTSADRGLLSSAHDLSEGGLAQALVEASLRYGIGADLALGAIEDRDGIDSFTTLFSESTARVLVSVPQGNRGAFEDLVEGKFPLAVIGETTNRAAVRIANLFDLPLDEAAAAHQETLPKHFG